MLSVCIPVYRYDVSPLAAALVRQRQAVPQLADVEILIYDDASPEGAWGHDLLRALPEVTFSRMSSNLGRAAIRNRLVRAARHPYCLMLDADAAIPPDFLLRYDEYLRGAEHPLVVVGGRRYAATEPPPPQRLHWWYGHQRESDANANEQRGWSGFHSNNFVASRQLLLRHPFPEMVVGYGHEDTLWGQQLAETGLRCRRIANAVTHLGLEPAEVFLRKQQQAVRNLHRLYRQYPHLRSRLIDTTLRYPYLSALCRWLPADWLMAYLRKQARPDLRLLDLLKLYWWYRA